MHRLKILLDQHRFRPLLLSLVVGVCLAFTPGISWAQLALNQTHGFGNGQLVTYLLSEF